MKRIVMGLAFALVLFAVAANAQTKTITGTVIGDSQGNKGNWETIDVQAGSRTYLVYINSADYPAARTVGIVNQTGRAVKVFYSRAIASSGDYAGAVIAVRIVEIKKSKPKNR